MNLYDTSALSAEAIRLLQSLISIPSRSREEQAAADCLQAYIEAQGVATQRKGNNVWCMAPEYDSQRPTLLLNSHIDTVRPVSGWTRDPFQPQLEADGRLYGLGSNDAGGSVVSLLQVFLTLSRTKQAYNLIFLASCEEEVSGKGGIESVLPELPPIACAIVGEPTGMQPAIAEKGLMVLDVTATGRSGHAARNEGDNAIYKVLDDIAWFRDYRFPQESPLLGPVMMSVTVIQAAKQHTVVPAATRATPIARCGTRFSVTSAVRLRPAPSVSVHRPLPKAIRWCSAPLPWGVPPSVRPPSPTRP